jgi:predicted ABC-type ATPase
VSNSIPRLRMFAGPNGSGKSTMKSVIRPELLGIYVNPDEIEKKIFCNGFLDLQDYKVKTTENEVFDFFSRSTLLDLSNVNIEEQSLRLSQGRIIFRDAEANPYFAAVVADFIRNKLVEAKESFTFETVMSHPEKIELFRKAQESGYRNYLYYVATDDPLINISRVRHRVKMGGHSVPEDKIVSRYYNSLNLLMNAVQNTHRAYVFDNSGTTLLLIAEITDGKNLEMKTNQIPTWFKKAIWDKFNP